MEIIVSDRLVNSGRPIDIGVSRDNAVLALEFRGLPQLGDVQTAVLYWTINDGQYTGFSELTTDSEDRYVFPVTRSITAHEHDRAKAYIEISSGDVYWHSFDFTLRIHPIPDVVGSSPVPSESVVEEMLSDILDRVAYTAQTKTSLEKQQARQNIGAYAVSYDSETETLTFTQ